MTVTPPRNPEARKLAPLAHEIAQLAGELRQLASPQEMVARPADGFVASFTGANLLRGTASPGKDQLTEIRLDSGEVVYSADRAERLVADAEAADRHLTERVTHCRQLTAAIADAPQMPVPTASIARSGASIPSARKHAANARALPYAIGAT